MRQSNRSILNSRIVELLENQTQLQREKLTNLLWVYFKGQVELETDNGIRPRKSSKEENLEFMVEPLRNSVRLRMEGSRRRVNYSKELTQCRPYRACVLSPAIRGNH